MHFLQNPKLKFAPILFLMIWSIFCLQSVAFADQIASLQEERRNRQRQLNDVEMNITKTQMKLTALEGLRAMPKSMRNAAIRQYLRNFEGLNEDLIAPALFSFDLDREITKAKDKVKRAENHRVILANRIVKIDETIEYLREQERATEEYFRDPLAADLRNERNHLAYLLRELQRPMDAYDKRQLEWQIENTRRKIAELEAQIAERDRQRAQQQIGPQPTGTRPPAPGGYTPIQPVRPPQPTGGGPTGGSGGGQRPPQMNPPRTGQLNATLDCGPSFELSPGDFMGKNCNLTVTGWRSNTEDRVFLTFDFDPDSGIEVTPGDTSVPPSLMYTPGVTDNYNRYVFQLGFKAGQYAPQGNTTVLITVRQRGAGRITLPLTISVIRPGLLPSSGSGIRPPATVVTGSGGAYCVWRYKLFGDPPPCFHFVAAGCNSARYNNPRNGYEMVGQNMTFGEADALIGRLSKYFKDEYGCFGGDTGGGTTTTSGQTSGGGQPQPKYGVFILTNVSGGSLWVGKESDLEKRAVGSFRGGGTCKKLENGCSQVTYTMSLGPFPSMAEAKKAYCASRKRKFCPPLVVSCKAEMSFGTYWIASAPGCP